MKKLLSENSPVACLRLQRRLTCFNSIIIFLIVMTNIINFTYAQEQKIAVLPFEDSSDYPWLAKKRTNFVEKGLPEIIMTRLSSSKIATVINLPERYNAQSKPSAFANEDMLAKLWNELKVTCIIIGSFTLLDNNKVRIDARVHSTQGGTSFAGASVEGDIKDKEKLAESLATKIIDNLRSKNRIFAKKYSENLRDWDADNKILAREIDPANPLEEFIITGKIWFENHFDSEGEHLLGTFEVYVNQHRIATISPNDKASLISQLVSRDQKGPYAFYVSLIDKRFEYFTTYRSDIITHVSFSITIEKNLK